MQKNRVLSVATTIHQQLVSTTDPNVLMSWGISSFKAAVHKHLPALAIAVDARLFSGTVIIALASDDTYQVHLLEKKSSRLVASDICSDQMADVVDVAIERGEDPEEYDAFCQEQLAKLLNL